MYQSGFLLGKFMPFHEGHRFLIESARQQCKHLTVLVCTTSDEPIPGWIRYHWVKQTFPTLDVRHVTDELPAEPADHPDFWPLWTAAIRRNTPHDIEVVFSSEEYGDDIAHHLGIQHVIVDIERVNVPISATQIRANPMANWAFIPPVVRPYYIKRVALLGPESCGKSYLTEWLAREFQTAFVEEYGRTYCERFGMELNGLDFAHIAGGQLYREDEMALQANRVLICDTDLIVTQAWSEVYFNGKVQPWILWANHLRRYDLFLLLRPDIPWVNDGLREYEHQRDHMFERLRIELVSRGLPFVVIEGPFDQRNQTAFNAVKALLS
jgi:HTH-type transcriptional regulator, transcriptional repressor of NAD biosynthesis genes